MPGGASPYRLAHSFDIAGLPAGVADAA
jgi:hypothetical protein